MVGTRWRRSASTLLAATAAVALLAGCGTGSTEPASTGNPDNGTTLTMWARNTSNNLAQNIVDQYNATHKNHIDLTIIPNESIQQKVGAAAAAGGLPDILASDVVYAPNYLKQGLFADVTDKVERLPFYDDLGKAHIKAATLDDKIYGTPFIVDSSIILYNKTLFAQAGLDPEAAPTSYDDILEDSRAVRNNIGGDVYGFYFGGNCSGCNAYTMFGNLAAAGEDPFTDDGATANIDTPALKETLDLYKQLWDEGLVAPSAQNEDGVSWNTLFNEGKIGILPRGTGNFANLKDATFDWGVAPLPAPDGSETSAFIGGDIASITATSKHATEAWNFIEWTLGDENQVDIVAKNGSLPSRIDLAKNEYSAADPRLVTAIEGSETGYTPSTLIYGNAVNNANGPWLKMIRDYIFDNDENAISEGQKAIQDEIDQAR